MASMVPLSIPSIVVCTFVRYKIPLQKAHVICKVINVQNDAKLQCSSHKRQNYQKHSWIFRKIFNFDSKWEHSPYKVFDYSVKIYFAQYHTPLKNFMDNPPTHNKKEKHTHHACCLTIRAWIQWFVFYCPFLPLCLAQLGHKFTPRCVFTIERVWYGRIILRTGLTNTFIRIPNSRQHSRWRTCCIVQCVHSYSTALLEGTPWLTMILHN